MNVREQTAARDVPSPRNERQLARRQAILRAAGELAARGGFDQVQMRDVAELSGVALGTLYRYFPSKTHLLLAVMRDLLQLLHERLRTDPPPGADPARRVEHTLMRAFDGLRQEPRLAEAMVRAFSAADRSVAGEVDAVSQLTRRIILDAVRPAGEPSPGQLAAVRVIEHTWQASLVGWLSGRADIAQVRTDVATACLLLGAGRRPS